MAKFDANALQRPNLKPSGAATVGIQQAIGGMSGAQAGSLGSSAGSQMGAQKATQEGQEIAQKLGKAQDVKQKRGQIGINKFATQQRSKMSKRTDNARRTALDSRQRISAMGSDLEQKLFQDRMTFESDARGVRFGNIRQLADFKRLTTKSDEEYQNFAQNMSQRSTEKRKLLQIANAKITQALTQLSKSRESEANFQQEKRLLKAQADINEKIKKDAASAKNRALIFQGVGMVAGGIATGGNPVGIAAGGSAGMIAAGATT